MRQPNRKLVFISETFPPDLCGVADYVAILAQQLADDYEVHVITRAVDKKQSYRAHNVNIHEVMASKLYVFDVLRLLSQLQPDLVDVQLAYSLAANSLNQFNILSSFLSLLIRLSVKTKLVCTIHELTSYLKDGRNSGWRSLYRQFRDYFGTRLFDYYFCVDRQYLEYVRSDCVLFLPNFSNIPSLVTKSRVDSHHLLYFGTIAHHKNIDCLLNLFSDLLRLEPECKLFLVGGLTKGFDQSALRQAIANLPEHSVEYLGYLDQEQLAEVMAECSYAIFPFAVTDKNASVLAMLVNGLVVFAEADHETIFEQGGNHFYQAPKLNAELTHQWIKKTFGQKLDYKTYEQQLNEHLALRKAVYHSLITSTT